MFRPSNKPSRGKGAGPSSQRNIVSQVQPPQHLPALADSSTPKMQNGAQELTIINAFQTHIDDMRNLIMCKICIRPLYEPFSLGCGHTYCYSCLSEWFTSKPNRRKRSNCPDCRAEVKIQPSPNYLLRELVHMFVSCLELLDRDETLQEHHEAMLLEARQVEKDKTDRSSSGGLFKGVFKNQATYDDVARGIIRDYEDGIDRCPRCAWELEEGECNHCGFSIEDNSGFSDDDERSFSTDYDGHDFGELESELDGEMDIEDGDAFGYDFDLHHHARLPIHNEAHRRHPAGAAPHRAISVHSDSGTDHTATLDDEVADEVGQIYNYNYSDETTGDEDESGSEEMRSFIDDDELEEELQEESDGSTVRTRTPRSPISISSNPDPGIEYNFSTTNSVTSGLDELEEEDDVEEDGIIPARKPPGRILRRNRVVMESSEDEESDTGESEIRTVDGGMDDEGDASETPTLEPPSPPRPAADRRAYREAQRARRRR